MLNCTGALELGLSDTRVDLNSYSCFRGYLVKGLGNSRLAQCPMEGLSPVQAAREVSEVIQRSAW